MAQFALFIARMLEIYSFIIWIRILFSWISPYSRPGSFSYYLGMLVDPYLNLFRTSKLRVGMLDFSPLFAIGLLSVVQSVFNIYGFYGRITLSLIVQLFIQAFWAYGLQVFFSIGFIMLVMTTIASFMRQGRFKFAMSQIGSTVFGPMEAWIQRTFFRNRIVKATTMNLLLCVVYIVLYFGCKYLLVLLLNLAMRIPF